MSTSLLNAPTGLQARVISLVEQNWFGHFILTLILINAVQLGMETSASLMAQYGTLLMSLDKVLLSVFVVELLLRIYAYRGKFFKDPWSVFDFTVIVIALIPASGPLAVLRSLRVLRVLRVLTIVPSMKRVVSALLGSLPGLASIATVLLLIYYVFAVIATKIFGGTFPEWFGTIADSFYTLFQIMTLESWSMGISRPVMEVYPYAWVFFVPFILVATFTMLNLFIAIIVNTMQTFSDEEHALEREQDKQVLEQEQRQMHEELKAIRLELQQLQTLLRSAAGDSSNVSTKGDIGSD
ncbi:MULTISPECIES: ion transporter [Shewanella]|jgi:voltage-gated sodium channel|uniref:ion transporter n=1 Tax=Shewanella TaxID=22 RepID=UPI001567A65D|nr:MULTISPECIES: ion transporter [Shewanella]MBP7663219.1 ion transporter [Shewanella sp.]NRD33503.1 ion transporter [Shewanella sp. DC2-4]WVI92886.1 ion transporter [Shewanella oncorhynchi]